MIRNALGVSALLAAAVVPRAAWSTCSVSLTSQSGNEYTVNVDGVDTKVFVDQASTTVFDASIIIEGEEPTQWLTGDADYNGGILEMSVDRDSGLVDDLLHGSTTASPIATTWAMEAAGVLQGAEAELAAFAYALEDFFDDAQSADMADEIVAWVEAEGCAP